MEKSKKDEKMNRKRFLISPGFQIRYIGIMLSTVLVSGFIIGVSVYLLIMNIISSSIPGLDKQKMFDDFIFAQPNQFFLVSLIVIIVVVAVVLISIYVTHKISGPEYRIKRILESMGNGDFAVKVKLRKGDELQSLADSIEDVNRNISFIVREQRKMVSILDSKLNLLVKETKKAQPSRIKIAALTDELSKTAKQLKEDYNSLIILED